MRNTYLISAGLHENQVKLAQESRHGKVVNRTWLIEDITEDQATLWMFDWPVLEFRWINISQNQ